MKVATASRTPHVRDGQLVELSLEDPRWVALVEASENATPFHHPAWAQLLAECYRFRAFALAVVANGRVTCGLPVIETSDPIRGRRWISLPFTDACPPLADSQEEPRLAEAIEEARLEAGVRALEVRGRLEGAGVHAAAAGYRHTLALHPDSDRLLATFTKGRTRGPIRQGERFVASGALTVRRAECEEDLTEVFYGLHVGTHRRLGVPVQPRRFFRLLWRRMLAHGLGFALLAYSEGKAVAGAVFLTCGTSMVYKFAASDRSFQRLRPNHVLLWHAMQEGVERGLHTFDFGRTDLDAHSLREFKLGWGTTEDPLVYSGLGAVPTHAEGRLAAKALGAVIRRSPLWVCRVSGGLLYRYAA